MGFFGCGAKKFSSATNPSVAANSGSEEGSGAHVSWSHGKNPTALYRWNRSHRLGLIDEEGQQKEKFVIDTIFNLMSSRSITRMNTDDRCIVADCFRSQLAVLTVISVASFFLPRSFGHDRVEYRQLDGTFARRRGTLNDGGGDDNDGMSNAFTVASRQRWSKVVRHCREKHSKYFRQYGVDFRWALGCTWEEHALCLREGLGMEPQVNPDGTFKGYQKGKIDPLMETDHILNRLARVYMEDMTEEEAGPTPTDVLESP